MVLKKTTEDFLEAILVLRQQHGFARSVDVAQRLGVSKPAVSTTLKVLIEAGYVEKAPAAPFGLSLTDAGREVAEQTYARHCFFRDWLIWAGIDPRTADREACELEHAISPESFRTLRKAVEARAI